MSQSEPFLTAEINTTATALTEAEDIAFWLGSRFFGQRTWNAKRLESMALATFHLALGDYLDSPPVRALNIRVVTVKPEWMFAPTRYYTIEPKTSGDETM